MSRVGARRCNRVIYRATCTHCGRDTMDSPTNPPLPLLSLSSTWKILISPEGGYEREREWETGWANNDDCWLRFQPGIRETCRFFSPFLGIYNVYHPSATHVFPQLMAAIVERIKDTFWCIRLSGASRCRDFFNPLTYLDYPLLLEIDIDAHATKSIFPSGNGVSMQVGCNGTNWDKFQNFNNNTDY